MNLEQTSPNKPNFLLIVLIAAAVILIILFIALAAVRFDGKRLLPNVLQKKDRSQLVLPNVQRYLPAV